MSPEEIESATMAVCQAAPVMPVVVIEDAAHAPALAEALVAGGLPAIEVTLRTPAALDAIAAIASVKDAVVGAGTLITPDDVLHAKNAGARFGVSPGATPELLRAAREADLPLIPGVATASEAMAALAEGYRVLKFFPASAIGGAPALKALSGPLPQLRFCPTGGVNTANARDYLTLPNVLCVGGSWVAPTTAIAEGKWDAITRLAAEACALGGA